MAKLSLIVDSFSNDISDQIGIVRSLDLNYIELRNVNGKNIVDNTDEEICHISNELIERNISVSSICTVIGKPTLNEPFSVQMSKLLKSLKIAQFLRADYIRIFADINCDEAKLKRILSKLYDVYKIKICIENEKNTNFEKLNDVIKFFQCDYYKKIGLTLDIANFVEVGERPLKVINLLKEQATYFHIRDLDINNKETHMFEGTCEIKRIISSINKKDKLFTYEPKLHHISSINKYNFFANNVNTLIDFINEENKNVVL